MDKRFWNIYDRSYLFVVLSILLVLVYIWSCNFELQSVFFGPSKRQLIRAGGLITSRIDRGELYRLCTSIFLHGDLLHLGLNTSAMWVLGRLCQTVYGGLRSFLVFLEWSLWCDVLLGDGKFFDGWCKWWIVWIDWCFGCLWLEIQR